MFKYLLIFILLSTFFEKGYANSNLFSTQTNLKNGNIKQKETSKTNNRPKKYLEQKNSIKPILLSALGISLVFFIIRYRNYISDYVRFYLKSLIFEDQQKLLHRIEEFEKRDRLQTENEKNLKKTFDEQLKSANETQKNDADMLKKRIAELEKKANESHNNQGVTSNQIARLEAGIRAIDPSFVKYQKSSWEKNFSDFTRQLGTALGISGRALYFVIGISPLALLFAIYKFFDKETLKTLAIWGARLPFSPFSWYTRLSDNVTRQEFTDSMNGLKGEIIDELTATKNEIQTSTTAISTNVNNACEELREEMKGTITNFDTKHDAVRNEIKDAMTDFNTKHEAVRNEIKGTMTNYQELSKKIIAAEAELRDLKQKMLYMGNSTDGFKKQINEAIELLKVYPKKELDDSDESNPSEIYKRQEENIKRLDTLLENLTISNKNDLEQRKMLTEKVGVIEEEIKKLLNKIEIGDQLINKSSFETLLNNFKSLKAEETHISNTLNIVMEKNNTLQSTVEILKNEIGELREQIKANKERLKKRTSMKSNGLLDGRFSLHPRNETKSKLEIKPNKQGTILLDLSLNTGNKD